MKTVPLLHILVAVHTLIGAISTFCLFYLFWAAWKRRHPARDKLLLLALIWPLVNLILLACNGWVCPLQNAAQALSGQHAGWVRDIYLVPESWLRIVPWSYPLSYVVGAALVWWRARRPSRPHARASRRGRHPEVPARPTNGDAESNSKRRAGPDGRPRTAA